MKTIKSFKIRFANRLHSSLVYVEGQTVNVKTLNGTVQLDVREGEDVNALRDYVYELVRGTPANVADVSALLELCVA